MTSRREAEPDRRAAIETEDYPVTILTQPIGVDERPVPNEFRLGVKPNPSRDRVTVDFALPHDGEVSLSVYDVAGRVLRELACGPTPAGMHSRSWDYRTDQGRPVSAGLYLVKLRVGDRVITRTLVRIQ